MRIEDRRHSFSDVNIQKTGKPKAGDTNKRVERFSHFLLGEDGGNFNEEFLNYLLEEFEKESKKLEENPSEEQIQIYKEKLEAVLSYVIKHAYKLKLKKKNGIFKDENLYEVVKKIKAELEELMFDILQKEKKQLMIIERIGKIHGLVINLVK